MKKLFIALMALFAINVATFADVNGLQIVMNEETEGVTEILFTDSPVLSHNADGTEISISYAGAETPVVLKTADIAKMVFVEIPDSPTGLNQIFPAENDAVKGIYNLNGQKFSSVNELKKGQVYIINGKKVMVK